jgi:chromosomal replication initiation ATPase DnaA
MSIKELLQKYLPEYEEKIKEVTREKDFTAQTLHYHYFQDKYFPEALQNFVEHLREKNQDESVQDNSEGIHRILDQVAKATGVTSLEIQSGSRVSAISYARHIFCWWSVENGYSYSEISVHIRRHRTAISKADKVIQGFIKIKDKKTIKIIHKLYEDNKSR